MKKIEEISDDGIDYRKLYDDSVNAITSLDNKPDSVFNISNSDIN